MLKPFSGAGPAVLVLACLAGCTDAEVAQQAARAAAQPERAAPKKADSPLVAELRAAVRERVLLDGMSVVVRDDGTADLVNSSGAPPDEQSLPMRTFRALREDVVARARMRSLGDAELERLLQETYVAAPSDTEHAWPDERVLLEIVRRGGDAWRATVEARIDAIAADLERIAGRAAAHPEGDEGRRMWEGRMRETPELGLVTALRRLEGRSDPIRLETSTLTPGTYVDAPSLSVRLVSRADRPILMTDGGNYRSGRKTRFRVEVRNAEGRIMPDIDWPPGLEGGEFGRTRVPPGESLSDAISIQHYVAPLPPGDYRVRVRYHDFRLLAYPEDAIGHMTIDGDEFTWSVRPRVAEASGTDRR